MNLTHTFLIKNDGSVWGIGNNQYGQLGTGETSSTVYNMTQMLLPSNKIASSVSGTELYTMVLMSDGTLWGTGYNNKGQLGIDTSNNQYTELQEMLLPAGKVVKSFSCGGYDDINYQYTIVLMTDGTIWGVGDNSVGQLGIGTTSGPYITLQEMDITMLTEYVKSISVRCSHNTTIVLMNDGTIWGTGNNTNGQLGITTLVSKSSITQMTTIPSGKKGLYISCNQYSTIVLMHDGTIWGCGYNYLGCLGIGSSQTSNNSTLTEMTMPSGKIAKYISSGLSHNIALMTDNTLYSVGRGDYGQLGLSSSSIVNKNILTSMQIDMLTNETPLYISNGSEHTLLITENTSTLNKTIWGCGGTSGSTNVALGDSSSGITYILTDISSIDGGDTNINNISSMMNLMDDKNDFETLTLNYVVQAWNYIDTFDEDDYLEIVVKTDSPNITLHSLVETQYRPLIPSAILTMTQITHTQSGEKGSTGAIGPVNFNPVYGSFLNNTDISNNTYPYVIPFTEEINTGGIDLSGNNKILIPTTSKYNIQYTAQCNSNGGTGVNIWLSVNGTNISTSNKKAYSSTLSQQVIMYDDIISLTENDYLQLNIYGDSNNYLVMNESNVNYPETPSILVNINQVI